MLGKFESEPRFVEYFWNLSLEGGCDREFHDEDNNWIGIFILTPEDKDKFAELGNSDKLVLRLWEDDNGFVYHSLD